MMRPAPSFDHPALFYRNAAEYTDVLGRFVHDALHAGHPVAVAVPQANLQMLREHVGADAAARVSWTDMQQAGRNPGRIIPTVLLATARRHPGKRVHIIGEPIWAARTETEYPACALHEALINNAFIGRDAVIICPYDTVGLRRDVLTDAEYTHPTLVHGDGRTTISRHYSDHGWQRFNHPLPPTPPDAAGMAIQGSSDLPSVRQLIYDRAVQAGMSHGPATRLVQAVNEVVSNTIRHTPSGTGRLSVWVEDGTTLVAQVEDGGEFPYLAGRIPPIDGGDGYGLILANLLCDLVRVYNESGLTRIRLYHSIT